MRLLLVIALSVAAGNARAAVDWAGTLCRKPADAPQSKEICTATNAPRVTLAEDGKEIAFRWLRRDGRVLLAGTSREYDVALDSSAYGSLRLRFDVDRAAMKERRTANVTVETAADKWNFDLAATSLATLEEIRLAEGEYRLTVAMPGWQTVWRRGLRVSRKEPLQLGRVAMTRLPRVTGRVIDAKTKEPVPNAAIASADGKSLALSAPNGTFIVDTLSDLPLYLTIEAADHAPVSVPLLRRSADDIDIGDVAVSSGGALRVHVARTCSSSCVTAIELLHRLDLDPRPNQWSKVRNASLRGSGDVEFENLPTGHYALLLKGEGPLEQRMLEADVRNGKSESLNVDVSAAELRGTVTQAGNPLANATLRFTTNERIWTGQLTTDQHGNYSTQRWQNGILRVTVQPAKESERYTLERSLGAVDVEWNLVVPAARISGRVFDKQSGEGVEGIRVFDTVTAEHFHSAGHAVTTDHDGRFTFAMAREGRHVLRVESPEHLDASPVTIQIAGDEAITDIAFALSRGNVAVIRVIDAAEHPVAQAFIVDRLPSDGVPDRPSIATDALGTATIPLAEKEQRRIWVVSPNGEFAVATLDASERTSRDKPRLITLEQPVATLTFHVARNGKPVAGENVMIQKDGLVIPPGVLEMIAFQQRGTCVTDERGIAVLPRMPAGSYIAAAYRGIDEYLDIRANRLSPQIRRATVGGGAVDLGLEAP